MISQMTPQLSSIASELLLENLKIYSQESLHKLPYDLTEKLRKLLENYKFRNQNLEFIFLEKIKEVRQWKIYWENTPINKKIIKLLAKHPELLQLDIARPISSFSSEKIATLFNNYFKQVIDLKITANSIITYEQKPIFEKLANIKRLECSFNQEEGKILFASNPHYKNLVNLKLVGNYARHKVENLSIYLEKFAHLKNLSLVNFIFTKEEEVKQFATFLKKYSLNYLKLKNCYFLVSTFKIAYALSKQQFLKKLSLEKIIFSSNKDLEELIVAISNNTFLKKLSIRHLSAKNYINNIFSEERKRNILNSPFLKELKLKGYLLTEDDLYIVLNPLKNKIKSLNLKETHLTEKASLILYASLINNQSLKFLTLETSSFDFTLNQKLLVLAKEKNINFVMKNSYLTIAP